jgi:hypothetical protein
MRTRLSIMRRREFIRGAGVLAGGALVGGAVASDAFARGGTAAQQVVESGVPQPRSVLTVRTTDEIDTADAERIRLSVPIVDPVGGMRTTRTVDVLEATGNGTSLRLVVDGPVSRGTVVSFDERSLIVDGRPTNAFDHTLDGAFASPERATRWFKAYEPTDPDYFLPRMYPDGRPIRTPERGDQAAVRDRLATHLDRFVERGRLTAEDRDATLGRFDDPTIRERFVDSTGTFDAVALAGVLANAGTVARGIDAVLIDGDNTLGEPYTIRRQPTLSGGLMEVRVDDGRPEILVDPRLDDEPFVVLAPLFAHEGFHQDIAVGLEEEIVATYLETLVWGEHLLANPSLARLGTATVRRANTMLLIVLNSGGRAFPEMGLRAAPHRQPVPNATPNGAVSVVDFVTAVESNYLETPSGSSPGGSYARQVIARVTGAAPANRDFDAETIGLLDEQTRLFPPIDVLQLLETLELRPAASATVSSPAAGGDRLADVAAEGGPDRTKRAQPAVDIGPGAGGHCGTCLRSAAAD